MDLFGGFALCFVGFAFAKNTRLDLWISSSSLTFFNAKLEEKRVEKNIHTAPDLDSVRKSRVIKFRVPSLVVGNCFSVQLFRAFRSKKGNLLRNVTPSFYRAGKNYFYKPFLRSIPVQHFLSPAFRCVTSYNTFERICVISSVHSTRGKPANFHESSARAECTGKGLREPMEGFSTRWSVIDLFGDFDQAKGLRRLFV